MTFARLFFACFIFFMGGLVCGTKINPPKPDIVYELNGESFKDADCRETTEIEGDGNAVTHRWHATTQHFYISQWKDGPSSCAEFKVMFTKDDP